MPQDARHRAARVARCRVRTTRPAGGRLPSRASPRSRGMRWRPDHAGSRRPAPRSARRACRSRPAVSRRRRAVVAEFAAHRPGDRAASTEPSTSKRVRLCRSMLPGPSHMALTCRLNRLPDVSLAVALLPPANRRLRAWHKARSSASASDSVAANPHFAGRAAASGRGKGRSAGSQARSCWWGQHRAKARRAGGAARGTRPGNRERRRPRRRRSLPRDPDRGGRIRVVPWCVLVAPRIATGRARDRTHRADGGSGPDPDRAR